MLNSKKFRSMHIMWELPTNKANFLFKNTQDFNQTTHVGPQEPIVLIDNINLYLNCLGSMKDVLKWWCGTHIMFFFSVTSQCMLIKPRKYFVQKKHFNFSFKKTHYFKDELTRSIINTSLFYNSQKCSTLTIIEFYWFMHSAFCGWMHFKKFHYPFFGRWFC